MSNSPPPKLPPPSKPPLNAALIQATNSSSIVSKRSVERLYHPHQAHYLKYFVRKPQRRSPTINRGYWLRMKAVESVVGSFLERNGGKGKKVVVNLGCGFDPLPWWWLEKGKRKGKGEGVWFVDVDYPDLMRAKAEIVEATEALREVLGPVKRGEEPEDGGAGVVMEADSYVGLGCDLSDLDSLEQLLRPLLNTPQTPVLFIAEVSMTYMEPGAADALIKWAWTISSDVTFALLEQFLPDGPDHPFARTMLNHFNKLRTPLRSIALYPTTQSQRERFRSRGWEHVDFVNLWELWSHDRFLLPSERLKLDEVEPFDEWEEFALFAGHYFLLTARPKGAAEEYVVYGSEEVTASAANGTNGDRPDFFVDFIRPKEKRVRRHGGLVSIGNIEKDSGLMVHIHGEDWNGRTSSSDFYRRGDSAPESLPHVSNMPSRQCFTTSQLADGKSVLFGGRTSPSAALSDGYLITPQGAERTSNAPASVFRHGAAAVVLPSGASGLVVCTGKHAANRMMLDVFLWDSREGWRTIPVLLRGYKPRFGALFVALGRNHGLLMGGLRADGVVLDDVYRWSFIATPDEKGAITFARCAVSLPADIRPHFGRFGASCSVIDGKLLIIGGISSAGVIPKRYEILSLDYSRLPISGGRSDLEVSISSVTLKPLQDGERPFLVGHCSLALSRAEVAVLGGGAVCFSFGTNWNTAPFVLRSEDRTGREWRAVDHDPAVKPEAQSPGVVSSVEPTKIQTVRLDNMLTFDHLVHLSQPFVIEKLDFGPCTTLWTKAYLSKKLYSREVMVHEASKKSMNFQRKDFRYVKKSVSAFLDEVSQGSHQYLRSTSMGDPAKNVTHLAEDFPEVAQDFCIPKDLGMVGERMHSSPLRITGDVAMWLHVDTMANVLFQIQGSKELVLFPPSDLVHLSIPHGSTTSTLEVFEGGDKDHLISVPNTTPRKVSLQAGNVLFIPPLWAHAAAAPNTKMSVAVNVFFRSLSHGYAAGRDVYGNRDLEAYETGRRDIAKIVRAFKDVPSDLANSYLLRLAEELKEKALDRRPS